MVDEVNTPPRLLVVGDTTIDHFLKLSEHEAEPQCTLDTHECTLTMPFGEKLPVEAYESIIAGNAANAAVGAVRLGLASAIWTVMGDDLIGHEAKRYLADQGIDVSHLELVAGEASNVSVVLRVLQERTILVYHYPRTYHLPNADHAGWLYLTSMAPGWETIEPALVRHLAAQGAKLVFQPGTHQLRSGHAHATALLHRTELFICNREEAADYTNHDRSASIRSLLVSLHALGPKRVVITDGLNGSYASDGQAHWFLDTRKDIERVEATGAGDAYASAFTAAMARGETIPTAMRWGNVNAESVIGFVGAQRGILTLAELKRRLADPNCLKPEIYTG